MDFLGIVTTYIVVWRPEHRNTSVFATIWQNNLQISNNQNFNFQFERLTTIDCLQKTKNYIVY